MTSGKLSNCLIAAVKTKLKRGSDIRLIPIWHSIYRFHVMWLDKKDSTIRHFTHKSFPGCHSDLLFRGKIEEVRPERLRKWIRKNNAHAPKF